MKELYLIDASIYIFRAYFSLPDTLVDAAGNPANAVYGFTNFLTQLLEKTQAKNLAVAFDESLTTSFRNEIYPAYKANRELPPPELEAQLKTCQEICQALGLATLVSARYEADDLIGTLVHKMRRHGFSMVIVSGDKDLAQLIQTNDVLWDFSRDRRLGTGEIEQQFGVRPDQIVDLIALAGDKVDNIPGVNGVGVKTAVPLLVHFGTLDALYARLDEVAKLPLRRPRAVHEALLQEKEQAYLSQRLARIVLDAPLDYDQPDALARQPIDHSWLETLCDDTGFGDGLRTRLRAVANRP